MISNFGGSGPGPDPEGFRAWDCIQLMPANLFVRLLLFSFNFKPFHPTFHIPPPASPQPSSRAARPYTPSRACDSLPHLP